MWFLDIDAGKVIWRAGAVWGKVIFGGWKLICSGEKLVFVGERKICFGENLVRVGEKFFRGGFFCFWGRSVSENGGEFFSVRDRNWFGRERSF